eukprot:4392527-Amphidinium_carterae.1
MHKLAQVVRSSAPERCPLHWPCRQLLMASQVAVCQEAGCPGDRQVYRQVFLASRDNLKSSRDAHERETNSNRMFEPNHVL